MICRLQRLRVHEAVRQFLVPVPVTPKLDSVVHDLLLGPASIPLQHLPGIGVGKDRLYAGTDVSGVEADRSGRSDRGQQRVSDAVLHDQLAHILVHTGKRTAREIGIGVKERKRTLLRCKKRRSLVGGAGNRTQPARGQLCSLFRSIPPAGHDKGVGQPRDPQTDPPLCLGLPGLRLKRKPARVDNVVHHPHCRSDKILQSGFI